MSSRARRTVRPAFGVTLLELVLVIVVIGVLAGAGASLVADSLRSGRLVRDTAARTMEARIGLDRIARELRSATGFTTITATQLVFNQSAASGLILAHSALDQCVQFTSGGVAPRCLARNVSSVQFQYFKLDGTTATLANDVRFVSVQLAVQQPSGATVSFTSRAAMRGM